MKLALILPSLVNKGPIIVAHTLLTHLVSRLERADVYYFDESEGMNFPCPTHRIRMDQPIDFRAYDVIHSHMYRPDKYVHKWRREIREAGVKTVTTIHQNIYANIKYSHGAVVGWALMQIWLPCMRSFDAAVPISEELYRLYRRRLPNITPVIYNGVDIRYEPEKAEPVINERIQTMKETGGYVIGSYAAITRRKGLDQLIRLLAVRPELKLVIIGEGDETVRLKRLAKRLSVQVRILFLPYLRAPYNYLEYIDIYAMPSRSEGFGLAHVEAAFTRTPVVCSDIPVFHELFDEKDVAFFELENIDSLSSAVDRCIARMEKQSEHAYATACEKFAGSCMADRYFNLYENLLAKTSGC